MSIESLPQSDFSNQAFRLEYSPSVEESCLYDDTESYLAEYRFKERVSDYRLFFYRDRGEIVAKDRESMSQKVRRGIVSRSRQGLKIHREEADLAGIQSLETQLTKARRDSVVIWASPPEEDSLEYGNYGFFYYGRLGGSVDGAEVIDISAVRIDSKKLDEYSQALQELTGNNRQYEKAEEFIANPYVLEQFNEFDVLDYLSNFFKFTIDKTEKKRRQLTMQAIKSNMKKFIDSVKNAEEKRSIEENFLELEWYAEKVWKKLKDNKISLNFTSGARPIRAYDLVGFYDGSKLATVDGSCGATAKNEINLFTKYSSISTILKTESYKDDPNLCRCSRGDGPHFHCPGTRKSYARCDHPIVVGRDIKKCPSCGLEATCK